MTDQLTKKMGVHNVIELNSVNKEYNDRLLDVLQEDDDCVLCLFFPNTKLE